MNIQNQQPQVLSCEYIDDPAQPFDPVVQVEATITKPIFTPLTPGIAPTIVDDDGNQLTEDDVTGLICQVSGDDLESDAEDLLRQILPATLMYYDASVPYPAHRLFVNQAANRLKMPLPSQRVLYTVMDDVIQPAKQILANDTTDNRDTFMAGLAFTFEPNTFGVAFKTAHAFDAFKTFVHQVIATRLNDPLNPAVTLAADFEKKCTLTGSLIESVTLRKNTNDGNDPESFARLLPWATINYAKTHPDDCFLLPFTLTQWYSPEHMVFVNVEEHAHAIPSKVSNTWHDIVASISTPVRIVSTKHIARLTQVRNTQKKIQQMLANSQSNRAAQLGRFGNVPLSKRAPKPADVIKRVIKIMNKLGFVNHSQNQFKRPSSTFMKPNRRNPDNFNLPGRTNITAYKPDIHVYVDTSGSISEDDYKGTVQALIQLTRKLNVNLYFTSFSHIMSETTLIHARGRTAKQMWAQIERIPKVSGGTDYQQIWRYILANKHRRQEFSLIITDFAWTPPSTRVQHPKNLYYAPCTAMDYNWVRSDAESFIKHMSHIEPNVRSHLLF